MENNKKIKEAISKKVGLSQTNKKMLEFHLSPKEINPSVFLYHNALDFYRAFKKTFGQGYETVLGYDIPITECLSSSLVLFHFSVELLLKAIISLKIENKIYETKTHEINVLLRKLNKYFPGNPHLLKILNNNEYILLLSEFSKYNIELRYGEVSISLRPCNKKGWKNKKPLQELSEALYDILDTLVKMWKEEIK